MHRSAFFTVVAVIAVACSSEDDTTDGGPGALVDAGPDTSLGVVTDAASDTPPDAASDADAPDSGGYVELPVEHGVFAVVKAGALDIPYDAPDGVLYQLASKPYVRGLSISFAWGDLEPTQGHYASVVHDVLAAVRTVRDQLGKPLSVKIHLRNGLVPDWLVPPGVTDDGGVDPFVFQTTLGFRALGVWKDGRLDVTLVPTEQAYVTQAVANITEVANQLDAADPAHDLVQIVQLAGPSSESGGTIRLTPREGFPRDGRSDSHGFHWTFQQHLDAWRAMGPLMASLPAYRARAWTFDLTHEPPLEGDDTVFGLSTADQMSVVDALVAAHPGGIDGIRLMREGVAAQSNRPDFPGKRNVCSWGTESFVDPVNLPEAAIAAWPRHEFQDQTTGDDAFNFPRFELARVLLFGDPAANVPTALQHTQFVELHDSQLLGAPTLLDSTEAAAWFGCLDSMLHKYAPAAATLSAADQTFWAAHPSESLETCKDFYVTTPPASTCAPP